MNLELEQDFVNRLIYEKILPQLRKKGFRRLYVVFKSGRIIVRGMWQVVPFSIPFRLVSFSGRRIHFSVDGPLGIVTALISIRESMFSMKGGVITLDLSEVEIPGRIVDIRIGGGRLRLLLR